MTDSELTQKYYKKARLKYKLASVGQYMNIYYRRNGSKYKLSGKYLGKEGSILKIGSKDIRFSEVDLKYQHLFDENVYEQKMKNFVSNAIRNYKEKKNLYFENFYYESKQKIIRSNIEAGYLYYNHQWLTAGEVINSFLAEAGKSFIQQETAGISSELSGSDDGRLKSSHDKEKIDLSLANFGVDAVCGYKDICWGMTYNNVVALLNSKSTSKANNSKDIYIWDNKDEQIRFYFYKKGFYKFTFSKEFTSLDKAVDAAQKLLNEFEYFKTASFASKSNILLSDMLFKRSLAKLEGYGKTIKLNTPVKWAGKDTSAVLVVSKKRNLKLI